MKLHINDKRRSFLIRVLRLDGTPAIDGEDFMEWTGTYHKIGGHSYQEGGVALKNGIVVFHKRSGHNHLNRVNRATVIRDNKVIIDSALVMGRIDETPERPQPIYGISDEVHQAMLDVIMERMAEKDPEGVKRCLEGWDQIEKFL